MGRVGFTENTFLRNLGIAAIVCYTIHAGYHLVSGHPEHILWACHLGALIVGVGLLTEKPVVAGIGTLFLCMGTPLWLMELLAGGAFMPTSIFTHVGGLVIGLVGTYHVGLPRGTWWKSVAALAALIALARLVTPAEANVNIAFDVQAGYENYFPSYPVYLVTMIVSAAAYFFTAQFLMRYVWQDQMMD